jgi:hypothetical protein
MENHMTCTTLAQPANPVGEPDDAQMLREMITWLTEQGGPVREKVVQVIRQSPHRVIWRVAKALAEKAELAGNNASARAATRALAGIGGEAVQGLLLGLFLSGESDRLQCLRALSRLSVSFDAITKMHLCHRTGIIARAGQPGPLTDEAARVHTAALAALEQECRTSPDVSVSLMKQWYLLPHIPNDPKLREIIEGPIESVESA